MEFSICPVSTGWKNNIVLVPLHLLCTNLPLSIILLATTIDLIPSRNLTTNWVSEIVSVRACMRGLDIRYVLFHIKVNILFISCACMRVPTDTVPRGFAGVKAPPSLSSVLMS